MKNNPENGIKQISPTLGKMIVDLPLVELIEVITWFPPTGKKAEDFVTSRRHARAISDTERALGRNAVKMMTETKMKVDVNQCIPRVFVSYFYSFFLHWLQ